MKTFILVVAVSLMSMATLSVRAQDIEPQPLQFQFNEGGAIVTRPFTVPPRNNKFHIGWQWGTGHRAVNDYFLSNSVHIDHLLDYYGPNFPDSTMMTVMGGGSAGGVLSGAAMQFDPAIIPNLTSSFVSDPLDTTGAVFGFRNKRGRRGDPAGIHYDRWIVEDTIPAGTVVLDSITPDNAFYSGNGNFFFLTLNLRLMSAPKPGDLPDDILLTIELPYKRRDSLSDTISFDRVFTAQNIPAITARGQMDTSWSAFSPGANKKIFAITRNMLPAYNAGDPDITIAAKFEVGTVNTTNPPFFRNDTTLSIAHLGIRVRTTSKASVGIDWVRIESPGARSALRGEHDAFVQQRNQFLLDTVATFGRGVHIGRFYGADEIGLTGWLTARNHTRLMNRYVTQETGAAYPKLFDHAVRQTDFWNGDGWDGNQKSPAPYAKYGGDDLPQYLGHKHGYANQPRLPMGSTPLDTVYSTFNGNFETFFLNGVSYPFADTSLNYYLHTAVHGGIQDAKLITYEAVMYGYANGPSKDLLYSSKPWWSQIWQTGNYASIVSSAYGSGYNDRAVVTSGSKSNTGEEIRLMTWSRIILGAKGLTYDRAYSQKLTPYINEEDKGKFGIAGFTNGLSNNESDWGSDFLNEKDDTVSSTDGHWYGSALWPHINRDTVAKYQRVPVDRIYLGRKSNRVVTKGIHEWIRNNEAELMRLRLVGWYAKGFRTFVNGDSAALKTRLRLPALTNVLLNSPYSITRPSWRTGAEIWDSAFVDFTILHDTLRSIDSSWIVGVQNRRTSPLILSPGFGAPGDTVRFVTTNEFNAMTALIPSQRYKQGGARTIAIPFGSIDTISESRQWVTYHVEEIHDGLVPLPGVKRIDTTIIQGTNLAVNFLPGEGKMFRVTVIRPDMELAAGELSHSNQRKLVAFPVVNSTGQMVRDTVRYHMTYHRDRPDKLITNLDKAVYYRRSVKVPRTYPADMIQWETREYQLSDSVERLSDGIPERKDCAYPSLVVRQDTSGTAWVYIVYGCRDSLTTFFQPKNTVVEHRFRANDSIISTTGTGHILARAYGSNYRDWATPMINASRNGNYYTWADSIYGIGLGFKPAENLNLSDTNYISWAKSWTPSLPMGKAQHPSLNTYSRISLNEDDCALVWQENEANSPMSYIYYSRLRMVNGVITPYLPTEFFRPEAAVILNAANTIANLSDKIPRSPAQEYPVVYRGVEDYPVGCADLHIAHWDRVTWQGRHDISENQLRIISCHSGLQMVNPYLLFYRNIDLRDSISNGIYVPRDWGISPTHKIWSGNNNLLQPTISQGGYFYTPTYYTNYSDSAIVRNFKAVPLCNSPSSLGPIWNLPSGYWSLYQKYGEQLASMTQAKTIVHSGQYPQLAALPAVNDKREWNRNRRVFEATGGTIPTILTSSQFFLRTATEEAAYSFNGFAKDSVRYIITPPQVMGRYINLYPLNTSIATLALDSCSGRATSMNLDIPDTIASNWTFIPALVPITYYALGNDTASVQIALQRQSTNTITLLPKPVATDTAAMDATYVIAPGDGDLYRILLIKNNSASHYLEEMVIDELPLMDLIQQRARAEQAHQDAINRSKTRSIVKGTLTCSLSPNPARDKIHVTVQGTAIQEPVRLVISTLLGETVRVIDTKTMEDTQISLSGLPSGQYMLRSSLTKSEFFDPLVIPFVIER